ncbi:hypothetical protein [Flavihumibacter fluvii]|uniref:hypothetical protein n=1 Tax=Flavihumibacter fluvii TaxID=2838157 RepID=UPI001BDF1823|nr:hypothetical protein [Flavihumibacter fluvii]ULQ54729.1 hypothetical protein KJS93_10405 [Flavihumibacter fluvii]
MGKLIKVLVVVYLLINVPACKKDTVETPATPKPSISNLQYLPDTVALIKPGSTLTIHGSVDFTNAAGGVSKLRLTTSTGSDITVLIPSNAQTSGTVTGVLEALFPAEAGKVTFQLWIIDNKGNVSNKLNGAVVVIIDDSGKEWTQIGITSNWSLYRVTWANQRFMAVGESGVIVTASDQLSSWTELNSGTSSTLHGIIWSGSQYITVGSSNTILSSPDGTEWTSRFSPPAGSNFWFNSIAWSGNVFVAAGIDYSDPMGSTTAIFNSTDGNTWTKNAFTVAGGEINSVIWANGQYVAVGKVLGSPLILTSSDGLSWVNRSKSIDFGKGSSLSDITYTGRKYAAVGFSLTATSTDAINWTINDNISWGATGVTWSGHTLLATSVGGGIYGSTDGLNWSITYDGATPLASITWSGYQYVSVGFIQPILLVSPALF